MTNEQSQSGTQARQGGCILCDIGDEVSRAFQNLWPEGTREHFRNSRIEFLKGIRSILDARIDRLSRQGDKGTRVVVE